MLIGISLRKQTKYKRLMKKTLAILALTCVASFAFGQGQVAFVNTTTTLVTTNSVLNGPATGSTGSTVPGFYYGLFSAPVGTVDANAFTFTGYYGTNQAAAGRFNGGAGTGSPAIAGAPIGSSLAFLVRGWSANLGRDWNGVQAWVAGWDAEGYSTTVAGFYGQSGIASAILLGGGATPISSPFGNAANQINTGFTLGYHSVIPEPSSMALAGLGAASLLIFRRRK
jgi:hypothetical protein